MHAAVDTVDDGPGAIGDLVDHADADDLAGERVPAATTIEQGIATGHALDTGLGQRALHHLDLVGAFTEPAQLDLDLRIERPDTRLLLGGKPHALKGPQASEPHGVARSVGLVAPGQHQHVVLGADEQ